ncbi:hypothetical protein MMC30_002745 [Trapelia coarctata]|nr:hypothetical protein [Trapelia coarctata]
MFKQVLSGSSLLLVIWRSCHTVAAFPTTVSPASVPSSVTNLNALHHGAPLNRFPVRPITPPSPSFNVDGLDLARNRNFLFWPCHGHFDNPGRVPGSLGSPEWYRNKLAAPKSGSPSKMQGPHPKRAGDRAHMHKKRPWKDRNLKRGTPGRPKGRVTAKDDSRVLQGRVQKVNWGKKDFESTSPISISPEAKISLKDHTHPMYLDHPDPLSFDSILSADTAPSVHGAFPEAHLTTHAPPHTAANEPMEIDVLRRKKSRKGDKGKSAGGTKKMEVDKSGI